MPLFLCHLLPGSHDNTLWLPPSVRVRIKGMSAILQRRFKLPSRHRTGSTFNTSKQNFQRLNSEIITCYHHWMSREYPGCPIQQTPNSCIGFFFAPGKKSSQVREEKGSSEKSFYLTSKARSSESYGLMSLLANKFHASTDNSHIWFLALKPFDSSHICSPDPLSYLFPGPNPSRPAETQAWCMQMKCCSMAAGPGRKRLRAQNAEGVLWPSSPSFSKT